MKKGNKEIHALPKANKKETDELSITLKQVKEVNLTLQSYKGKIHLCLCGLNKSLTRKLII